MHSIPTTFTARSRVSIRRAGISHQAAFIDKTRTKSAFALQPPTVEEAAQSIQDARVPGSGQRRAPFGCPVSTDCVVARQERDRFPALPKSRPRKCLRLDLVLVSGKEGRKVWRKGRKGDAGGGLRPECYTVVAGTYRSAARIACSIHLARVYGGASRRVLAFALPRVIQQYESIGACDCASFTCVRGWRTTWLRL